MSIEGTRHLATAPEHVCKEILDKLANPTKGSRAGRHLRFGRGGREDWERRYAVRGLHPARSQPTADRCRFPGGATSQRLQYVQHDLEHAKFGWSHCLTLPQSAFGLSSVTMDCKLALAAALVWITAYRSVLEQSSPGPGLGPSAH